MKDNVIVNLFMEIKRFNKYYFMLKIDDCIWFNSLFDLKNIN